jgi:Raf kinase inhibitor-like YbhB/YbcL family protein
MKLYLPHPTLRQGLLSLFIVLIILPACSVGSDSTPAPSQSSKVVEETPTSVPTEVEPIETATILPAATPTVEPTQAPTDTLVPQTSALTPTPVHIGVTSPAFESGDLIPERYARSGDNLSLPLNWSDPPDGTKSYVTLFVGEPVADGGGTWILWALYNLPADLRGLPEGLVPDDGGLLESGGQHLENSYLELAYSGPPTHPVETRRFYMRIYALDTMLTAEDIEEAAATVDTWIGGTELILIKAMEGRILAVGQLSGKYKGESPVG